MYYKIEQGNDIVFQVCGDFATSPEGAEAIRAILALVSPQFAPMGFSGEPMGEIASPEVSPPKKRKVKSPAQPEAQPEAQPAAQPAAQPESATPVSDRDLAGFCVTIVHKIGGEAPADELRAFAKDYVPAGEIPSPPRILPDRRMDFIRACEAKWGVTYHG